MANMAARPFCNSTNLLLSVTLTFKRVPSQVSGKSSGLKTGGNTLTNLDLSVPVGKLVDLNSGNCNEHLGKTLNWEGLHGIKGCHGLKVSEFDVLGD